MAFQLSTYYQGWVQHLRLPWLGAKGRAIMGAFASVVGDKTIDWATQANLEHLPEYASAPSVALTASERQIDAGPTEATAALATRLTQAVPTWQRAGRPIGMLTALYYAGFPGAVIVQANGVAYSLSLPLPPITQDPSPNLVTTTLGPNPFTGGMKPIKAGQVPWWVFDSTSVDASTGGGVQFTSRFAVLFPGPTFPPSCTTWATATFSGTSDIAAVTWNNSFPDTTYKILPGPPTITDGSGGVVIDADATTKTTTGVTIRASAPFTGTVDVLAYQAGAQSPFADFHPADLARLRGVISKWRPAKSTCMGIFVVAQGQMWGWPTGLTWGTRGIGGQWGSHTVMSYSA